MIELLVVVVIILILAALLLPSLGSAVERGRFAACTASLKQLQSASFTYSGDNDRRLLEHRQWVVNGYNWATSTSHIENGTLFPYVGATGVYLCPTFDLLSSSTTPFRSYAMNYNIGEVTYFSHAQRLKRLSQINSPSTMPTFSEENSWIIAGYSAHSLNDGSLVAGSTRIIDNLATYHLTSAESPNSGVAAVVYADGHVGRARYDGFAIYNALRQ